MKQYKVIIVMFSKLFLIIPYLEKCYPKVVYSSAQTTDLQLLQQLQICIYLFSNLGFYRLNIERLILKSVIPFLLSKEHMLI